MPRVTKTPYLPFIGVNYLPAGSRGYKIHKNPWGARVIRCGKAWNCGGYLTPEDAARAYDNVSFYTSTWCKVGVPRLNFPHEYSNPDTRPKPTERTLSVMARLKAKFPEDADKPVIDRGSDLSVIEGGLYKLSQGISADLQLLMKTWMACVSKCRTLEATIRRQQEEIEVLQRTLQGVQSTIRVQHFVKTPVGAIEPLTEAQAYLDEPISDPGLTEEDASATEEE